MPHVHEATLPALVKRLTPEWLVAWTTLQPPLFIEHEPPERKLTSPPQLIHSSDVSLAASSTRAGMGCASSIVPQQQPSQAQTGRFGRPKRKLNALVPEPPARPAVPGPVGPRVGLVSSAGPSAPEPARAAAPPAVAVSDPQNYEELCVAFLKAVKRGDVSAMEQVAQLGVKLTPTPQSLVNIRGMWDSTPLVYAAQYAHAAAAHWLLARGADVLAQNEKGVTALLLASLEGLTDVCERILSVAALMGSDGDGRDRDRDRDERGLTAPRARTAPRRRAVCYPTCRGY